MQIPAIGENEAFLRNTLANFVLCLSPTVEQINDMKTAVSEIVTNAVVHAYEQASIVAESGKIDVYAEIDGKELYVKIADFGCGIDDIEKARQPLWTSKPDEERSGMGFTIAETFVDSLTVSSRPMNGTVVEIRKTF